MAEEAQKLALTMLRRLDEKLEIIAADVHELKVRVTAGQDGVVVAQRRIDRLEAWVERIERRLDRLDSH